MIYAKFLLTAVLLTANAQQIEYLNGLPEDEICKLNDSTLGKCRKITQCLKEFDSYRRNESVLKICAFGRMLTDDIICCPKNYENSDNQTSESVIENRIRLIEREKSNSIDYLDFETCRKELLKYRISSINPNHFARAMHKGIIPTNKKTCNQLDKLNKKKIGKCLCSG